MKKEQIIESARELFTQYGYKRVSMDEIAKKANVTKRTIYAYFKDKDELFTYFITEEVKEMKGIIETIETEQLPFFDKINKTIYELLKYKNSNPFIMNLQKEADAISNMAVKGNLQTLDDSIQDYIRQKLEYAIANHYVKACDIDIATFLIYKMYTALIYEYHGKPLKEEEVSLNISTFLKDGLFYQEGGKQSEEK